MDGFALLNAGHVFWKKEVATLPFSTMLLGQDTHLNGGFTSSSDWSLWLSIRECYIYSMWMSYWRR